MTTKPIASTTIADARRFPDFPPRDDMNNSLYIDDPAFQPALRRHLSAVRPAVVISEVPVGWRVTQRRDGLRIPDLLIAFDVDRDTIVAQRGYAIEEHGKPPDFVLEVASESTAHNDETGKRASYAAFGIAEYWRFDPEGGEYYQAALAGDRLEDGVYRPVSVDRVELGVFRGYSETLNLYVCWEHGQLRWFDPVARRYLNTFDEEADARIAAEAQVRQLQEEISRLRNR